MGKKDLGNVQKWWIGIEEAAVRLNRSVLTLRRQAESGAIDNRCCRKVGRYWFFRVDILKNENLPLDEKKYSAWLRERDISGYRRRGMKENARDLGGERAITVENTTESIAEQAI